PEPALVTQSYAVADLIVPITREVGNSAKKDGQGKPGTPDKPEATVEDRLIKLIAATVEPKSWKEAGGRGTMEFFPVGMMLVVNQTAAVQERIAALLADLRKAQEVEVALEIRFVTLSEGFFERIGVDFNLNAQDGDGKDKPPAPNAVRNDSGAAPDVSG